MICKVREAVEEYNLLPYGSEVIVALSGGADSMALLSCLLELREEYNLKIIAAHVNHGLRGKDADNDEEFVTRFCFSVNVQLHVLRVDVREEAEKAGEGSEECGRRIRYEFFESISETALIATAHNLNDQAETVLMHLLRGCSLNGLCGIPWKRGRIIRPLLGCTRDEIETYCAEKNLSFVTDKTNNENIYRRNRIRHDILPLFLNENPAFLNQINRMTKTFCEEEEFLNSQTQNILKSAEKNGGYSVQALENAPGVLRRRAIYELLKEHCNSKLESKHVNSVEKLIMSEQGRVQIRGNQYFRIRKGILEFVIIDDVSDCPNPQKLGETFPQKISWQNKTLFFERIYKKDYGCIQKVHKEILANSVDYDKIKGTLLLRCRLPGDKMRPQKSSCSKSFKKLFQEYGIPSEERSTLPILCDDDGVLWVYSIGADERAAVTEDSDSIICINLQEEF